MNRQKQKRVLYQLVFVTLICSFPLVGSCAQSTDESVRILFVGNSYTYYNSMPQMVKAMAEHKFPRRRIEMKFVVRGGATLKQHWETSNALEEIKKGRWDYVVLQEQSMLGKAVIENGKRYVGPPGLFFTYSRKFAQLIKQHGGEPVFFMTWSRKHHPEQQKYLTYAYMHIAKELNAKVAPVGMVWDSLRTLKRIDLYHKDGSHPSIQGSYLAALMLFAVIFDSKPAGIPGQLEGRNILRGGEPAAEESLLCNLPEKETKIIQSAVAAVYERMQHNGGYLNVEKAISDKRPTLFAYVTGVLTSAEGQAVVLIVLAVVYIAIKGSANFSSKRHGNRPA